MLGGAWMVGGKWSGQDLTIVADPVGRLLVSEKRIVSRVYGSRPETNRPQSPFALEALTMLKMSVG
jgi:hypothetical protein